MLDLGWTELLLIGIVALIVVGPKDLPGMFQAVGKFVGKARGMAREFSRAMNDAADQSGVGDIKDTFKKASNPMSGAMDEVRKATDDFTGKTMASGKPGLRPERQAQADKIRDKAASMANERHAAEAAAQDSKTDAAATADKAAAQDGAEDGAEDGVEDGAPDGIGPRGSAAPEDKA